MSNSPVAQTISLSALKSLPGAATFPNLHPKSSAHILSLRRKVLKQDLFSALSTREAIE